MITQPKEKEKAPIVVPPSNIYQIEDCLEEMLYDYDNGKRKGTTTHNAKLDQCWTWRKEEFNIWSGYANEGKSLFIKQLCMAKALGSGWKFAFCSPEDYPPAEFFDDMIHTLAGMPTDRDRKNRVPRDVYHKIADRIKDYFYFVYIDPPDNTIESVLGKFKKLLEEGVEIDAFIIDPLLKFARPKGFSEKDDVYAAYVGSMMVDFARKTRTSTHLVMHQVTPRRENGKYPEPSMYSMKGGGSWADGCDNVLTVWRPNYATDKTDDEVEIHSQKIKKQKLVGIPQRMKIRFNRVTNRYVEYGTGTPLFDFENLLKL